MASNLYFKHNDKHLEKLEIEKKNTIILTRKEWCEYKIGKTQPVMVLIMLLFMVLYNYIFTGFCLKTKTDLDEKIFINICKGDDVSTLYNNIIK